jgi:hypothetical protein
MSENKKGCCSWAKGKKFSDEHRRNLSKNHADFSLDKHPMWKGGLSFGAYCENWTKAFKLEIKERDGFICLNPCCYRKSNKLDVHHIDYNKKNCDPNNLITLCTSCNARANSNRNWHKEWYSLVIKNRYKGVF